jgi:hypothetical protein
VTYSISLRLESFGPLGILAFMKTIQRSGDICLEDLLNGRASDASREALNLVRLSGGNVRWVQVPDRVANPDGCVGYFQAEVETP